MTSAPIFTTADYLSALQKLMPFGAVWQVDPDSVQGQVEEGLVTTWSRLNQADADLLVDAFPATAVNLLPEWEAALGLPDPCAGAAPTISARQQQVVARLTNSGGQSAAYYIAVAASLGYDDIALTMFAPFRAGQSHAGDPLGGPWSFFTWQVDAPLNSIQYFRAGSGHAGDPLETWGNTVLECEIEALKPAHTEVQFAYGFDLDEGWGIDFPLGEFWRRDIGGAPVVGAFTDIWTTSRPTTATYRDATGLLATALANVPRVEYDSTGNLIGLLIEKASTNKFLRSQEFDNAAWTKNASSVTANQTLAADGTMTADKWIEDNTNAEHRVRQTIATAAGGTVSIAIFAEKGTRSIIQLRALDAASVGDIGVAKFDLLAGTVLSSNALGAATLVAATIDPYLHGYLCTLTVKPNATMVSCIADYFICDAGGNPSYLGDGASYLYIWGAQFEESIVPTSYTPTTTVAVTRSQDKISRTVGGDFSQLKGTIFAECRFAKGNNGANQFIVDHNDGSHNNNATLFSATNGSARQSINSGGGFAGLAFMASAIPDMTFVKIAGTWQLNDVSVARGGVLGTPDASAPLPINLTRVDLGDTYDGTQNVERLWIKRANYKPVRTSDVDLLALTA